MDDADDVCLEDVQRDMLWRRDETRVVGAEPDYKELDLGGRRCGR